MREIQKDEILLTDGFLQYILRYMIQTTPNKTYIPIVFDKSHLLTIGERLYSTSLDLVRELVANAYDADATRVYIELTPEEIIATDNGSGMNEEQLNQYLIIGSQQKRLNPISPKFKRRIVGEFGIGKFSALTSAERFVVETQHRESQFHARIIFDSQTWQDNKENWTIPCEILEYDPAQSIGTRITLQKIKKTLEPINVVRHIRERMPIGREDFKIFVNGNEVTATTIPGKRFPVFFTTPFGPVEGETILANLPQTQKNIQEAGITIRVKNISITKSLFGFEASHHVGVSRLRGSVNADFLPITSSRDNIIEDSVEYNAFCVKMKEHVRSVLQEAKKLSLHKENTLASKILREALTKIGRALKKNPSAFQEQIGSPPLGEASFDENHHEEGYVVSRAQFVDSDNSIPFSGYSETNLNPISKTPKKRRHLSLANRAIIRRMELGNLGIVCRMERFGSNYPPSFLEQGIIYINMDHPLYKKQMDNNALLTMFISTLISKELSLQKHPNNSSVAYNLQTQILTDAFNDVRRFQS